MQTEDGSSTAPAEIRCYAIRRVNPFVGVLQIIDTPSGRASSSNGVVWDIEVRGEVAAGWGSLNQGNSQIAYHRYGLWSQEEGLARWPMMSYQDSRVMARRCCTLIECVSLRLQQLPFRLSDNHELWLFDAADQLPLALLATALPDTRPGMPEPKRWVSCVGAKGTPGQHKYPAARELDEQVRQRAGFNVNKHWLERQADGSAITQGSDTGVQAEQFPAFLLTQDWPDVADARRAARYIDWIAPALLTLQQLRRSERQYLEQKLSVQAISIEHHWHLYPAILDQDLLSAARVQCRLEHANQEAGKDQR